MFNSQIAIADSASETRTTHYFDTIKSNPTALNIFLKAMPKGGDLHNHRAGATYAENLINYGLKDNYCINPKTLAATLNTSCKDKNKLSNINDNWIKRNKLINAWSMRHYNTNQQTGHDHFFNTFFKFGTVAAKNRKKTLTEITERAGEHNEIYLETMVGNDIDKAMALGKKYHDPNLEKTYRTLKKAGIQNIVNDISQQLKDEQLYMNQSLGCQTQHPKPGCQVTQRYQYAVLRTLPANQLFPQLVVGYMLAHQNPLVVAVNIVGAEDDQYPIQEYQTQMNMFAFLHEQFPDVKTSLHAGELWLGLVPPQALKNHIKDAVNIAKANRIGHGVDIGFENSAKDTIKTMANQQIAVEINLTSNAEILGITGQQHPFMYYLNHHVPVVLSTDDEGVLRTNLTNEYKTAVETYHLSYPALKMLARNSITYSFMPGKNLWKNPKDLIRVDACQTTDLGSHNPDDVCKSFLDNNPKAQLQWQLEQQFNAFEQQY